MNSLHQKTKTKAKKKVTKAKEKRRGKRRHEPYFRRDIGGPWVVVVPVAHHLKNRNPIRVVGEPDHSNTTILVYQSQTDSMVECRLGKLRGAGSKAHVYNIV